jgi:nicotinamide-nucleotide amidase
MASMLEQAVLPFLAEALGPMGTVLTETVQLFPIPESAADQRLVDLTLPGRNPTVGITVADGIVSVRLSARADGEEEARRMLEDDVEEVEGRFGHLAFGRGAATLGSALGDALEEAGGTVAVAESVTGGLIGSMLVDVPGMSRFLLADVVAYSDEAKARQLGVPRRVIEVHGAVSPVVAELMACGACRLTGADVGVSTTGIAGPMGATAGKPLGLVYVGITLSGRSTVHELRLHGDRQTVKDRAAKHALNFGRLALEGPDRGGPVA